MELPTKKAGLQLSVQEPSVDEILSASLQLSSLLNAGTRNNSLGESRNTIVYSNSHTNNEVNGTKCEILNVYGNTNTYFIPTTSQATNNYKHKVTPFRICESPVANFVGREDLLSEVHSLLKSCATKTEWLERTVIIYGLGGMGKSELARKYVQKHVNDKIIQNVAWIDSETKTSLEKSFCKIARKFELETEQVKIEEIVESVYEHFAEHFETGLFIFDNVEQLQDQEPYFGILNYLPTQQLHRLPLILITSRINEWETPEGRDNTVRIPELDQDQSVQLLRAKLKLTEIQKKDVEIQTELQNLAHVLQGYPLGLTLAAANIRCNKFVKVAQEIQKYIARLDVLKSGWIEDKLSGGSASKYTLVMKNVWQATFDKINRMGVEGECALTLLNILAFLPADGIEKTCVDKMLEFGYSPLKDYNLDGFSILEMFSLVSLLELGTMENKFEIRVHRHVQRCTRERLNSLNPPDHSYLLSIGRYLCTDDFSKELAQLIHRYLKQRKWPIDSLRLSIIFLSRYVRDYCHELALELAKDLSEATEANDQDYSQPMGDGFATLVTMTLYLVSEIYLCKKNVQVIHPLMRQWNEKYKETFDASLKIFTSALTLKNSLVARDVCPEVLQNIKETLAAFVDQFTPYKVGIKIRDSVITALDETTVGPNKDSQNIYTIYSALNIYDYDADELNQNSALGLKSALQLHFQLYNDASFPNQQLPENGPIDYERLRMALRRSRRKRTNPSVFTNWEKSIIKTIRTYKGLTVVQQNLSAEWSYLGDVIGFIFLLITDYNCSGALKKTHSFLDSLKEATKKADKNNSHHYLLLWFVLFPRNHPFKDNEGRMWSLDSVAEEMKTFLEDYWSEAEGDKGLRFNCYVGELIKALLPHLQYSESNGPHNLHLKTATALMDRDIYYRKVCHPSSLQGWEIVFKNYLNTRPNTPQEILEVGRQHGMISTVSDSESPDFPNGE